MAIGMNVMDLWTCDFGTYIDSPFLLTNISKLRASCISILFVECVPSEKYSRELT